jgi:hypothetical protein
MHIMYHSSHPHHPLHHFQQKPAMEWTLLKTAPYTTIKSNSKNPLRSTYSYEIAEKSPTGNTEKET